MNAGNVWIFLSLIVVSSGHSGENDPMITPFNGWKAIEVITEGDHVNGSAWEIPNDMDGLGAFLVNPELMSDATLRLHVNHEDDSDATISEINIHKGRLKKAITQTMMGITSTSNDPSIGKHSNFNFVESTRVAYDRWTSDAGLSWTEIDTTINDPKLAGGFCRFCSSQYYSPNAFGLDRGFADSIYITGEECDDGRLVALDVNSFSRDLYIVSGITGSLAIVTPLQSSPSSVSFNSPENNRYIFEEGHGGMTFDSWENAAAVDTGETDHVALLLAADGGTETLKLYIGKKYTDVTGKPDPSNFLARNGLLYGRWYYLSDILWEQDPVTRLWKSATLGRFVTDQKKAWSEPKFEDIDTNPHNPQQIVMAESESGVYVLDFDLIFDASTNFDVLKSSFSVRMISSSDHEDDDFGRIVYPDNVDWTRNDLIFVNKDDDKGGIWYMKSDGTDRIQIGETLSGGESTGILDVSEFLNYPPASAVITTNQGRPSSITLLLNPDLESFLVQNESYVTHPVLPPTSMIKPESPIISIPSTTHISTSTPTSSPLPPQVLSPTSQSTVSTGLAAPALPSMSPSVSAPASVDTNSTSRPYNPVHPSLSTQCPVTDEYAFFQVIQAEDVVTLHGVIKTDAKNFCGFGYIDFRDVDDGADMRRQKERPGIGNRKQIFGNKDRANRYDVSNAVSSRPYNQNNIAGISFPVKIGIPGTYKVSIRYSNGGGLTLSRSGTLLLNEEFADNNFAFPSTFGWNIWSIESRIITFDAEGDHNIDLYWTNIDPRPNLDWLSLELWMRNG